MRAWLLIAAILLLGVASDAEEGAPSIEALEARIEELRLQARYDDAAATARELLALVAAAPGSRPYEVTTAEKLVEALDQIAALPPEARRELALADSLTEVDDRCWEEGRLVEGAAVAMRQLEIRRRLLPGTHRSVAASLSSLGSYLHAQGDYAAAEPLLREALAADRSVLGDRHPDVATDLSNLALLLCDRGDFAQAGPLYREAVAMQRSLLGNEHPDVALTLNNLASLLTAQGDYASAEPLLREALAMRRKLLGDEHPDVAVSLNNLASLLKAQGDYAGAEPLYREALAMSRRLLGDEHPDVALTLANLAHLLYLKGDYEGAEPLFRESLAMNRKAFGSEDLRLARDLNNLGAVLMAKGDYSGAEALQRQALAIDQELLGDEHPDVARDINNLGAVLWSEQDYAGAEPLFRESLAMRRRLLGDEHPDVAKGLSNLAVLLWMQGDCGAAERLLEEASRIHDVARLRAGTGLERTTFRSSPYPLLAAARLRLGRTQEAWPAAEKALARSLADLLMATERALSTSEAAREDSLRLLLGELESDLGAYVAAARADTTGTAAERADAARNALLAAEAEWSGFQQEIATKYPVTEGQAYPLERVQAGLPENSAIVGWLDVEVWTGYYESWCYALRSSGPVAWAPVAAPRGDGSAGSPFGVTRSFRDALTDPTRWDASTLRSCRELWDERIRPLLPALGDVSELIVIPSGAMLGIPIEALVDETGAPVAESYSVSYAPSATICTWLAERRDRRTGNGALLVGDPPYTPAQLAEMKRDEAAQMASASAASLPAAETLRNALTGNDDALAALPRLPGTREEVTALAEVFRPCTVLLGEKATEQEFERLADTGELGEFGTIHLATHSLVDDERPERSALVLSQVGLQDPLEAAIAGTRICDGLVTADEILRGWDLNADLVTLSACETGLGREVTGEGYVGFAHAFLQAGAKSLLVSLWEVEDEPTSLLMRRFYENWLGRYEDRRSGRVGEPMSKADALREAKLWLPSYTQEDGSHPYARPYYWSAFILMGDPR